MKRVTIPILLAACVAGTALGQTAPELDALKACAEITDPAARLACFDAKLADAGSAPRQEAQAAPVTTVDPIAPASATVAPVDETPEWARAPEPDKSEAAFEKAKESQPNRLDIEIVKITRTRGNKLRFYTNDDQVLEQLLSGEQFDLPDALPATARIKKRMMGKPVIQFSHRNKSYKVQRIR